MFLKGIPVSYQSSIDTQKVSFYLLSSQQIVIEVNKMRALAYMMGLEKYQGRQTDEAWCCWRLLISEQE